MAYIKKTVRAGKTMEIIKYHDRAHGKKGDRDKRERIRLPSARSWRTGGERRTD